MTLCNTPNTTNTTHTTNTTNHIHHRIIFIKENAIHEVFLSFEMVEEMLSNMNPSVLFDMQKYHPSAFRKFLDYKNNFLHKMIKENLRHGMQEELYREDIDIEILSRYRLYTI